MGLFGKGKSGGLMNVIRCDEEEYLIWKWRPDGQDANSTSRENSIRYGSSLRVKDGEVAIFLYHQKNGTIEDFIEGPYDDTIKTANFPVLSSIVGLAFGSESPFQAEIYFINLAGNNQLRFVVPYFDVFDPRLPDHGVPVAVRGTITFNVSDYKGFIKLNRLVNFDLDAFRKQIQAALSKYIKGVVMNVPKAMGIPLVQMETQILEINERIKGYLKPRLENDFGVNMKGLDIGTIEINKESPYYNEIRVLTAGNTASTMQAQADINIQNMKDMQSINKENMVETLRIQREEMQRAQRLQSENANIGAFSVEKQAEVLKTGAENLGQMGSMNLSGGSGGQGGGSLNPAGMMTGMMMGGAVGQQMAGMMNNMGQQMQQGMNQQTQTPPQMPIVNYYVAVNGQQSGPFNMQQLQQSVQNGQLTKQTYVWKQGMANWDLAGNVQELASLFAPPIPNGMPTPPPMP
jgi:membrane protease subunit (stomatin/prohibitin family)